MMWLVVALIIFVSLLIIILYTKLTIELNYFHGNDNDHLELLFKIWFGLIRYKKTIPLIKLDDNSPTIVVETETSSGQEDKKSKEDVHQISKGDILKSLHDAKQLVQHVVKLHEVVRNFLSKISVKQLEWHTAVGIADAAYTAIATGGIWAVKGSIIGIISHYMKLKEMPKLYVIPYFQHSISQTRIKCIFQFRIGQAILAGIKLIKFWKGGRPNFKTRPLSALSRSNGQ